MADNKKPTSAKAFVERALRKRFVSFAGEKAKSASGSSLVGLPELVFAKRTGKSPRNITMRSAEGDSLMRQPKPKDRFVTHPHVVLTGPTIQDLFSFFHYAKALRGKTYVFDCVDSSFKGITLAGSSTKVGGKTPVSRAVEDARKEAQKIIVVGRVFLRPTKKFSELPKQKLAELIAYLEEEVRTEIAAKELFDPFEPDYPQNLNNWRKKHAQNVATHIRQTYGEVFSTRYVSMPGYHYDAKKEKFEKT